MAKPNKKESGKSDKKEKNGKSEKKEKNGKSVKKESPVAKSKSPVSLIPWEELLEKAEISDGTWKCNLAIMAETNLENSKYVQLFQEGAEVGARPVVKCIDFKRNLITELKQIQHIKTSTGDTHALSGVCKAAIKEMTEGNLSVEMIVKYLKYKLIRFKEDDIKRRKKQMLIKMVKEQKEIVKEDSNSKTSLGIEKESKKGSKAGKKKDEKKKDDLQKTQKKGGKGKKEEPASAEKREDWWNEQPSEREKIDTMLKVRGEKEPVKDFFDDTPSDGAELYVVLTGFHDPLLIPELVKQRLPLNAIIKVYGDEPFANEIVADEPWPPVDTDAPVVTEDSALRDPDNPCDGEGKQYKDHKLPDAEYMAQSEEINNFWKKYDEYILDKEINLLLKDVALFTYSPAEHIPEKPNAVNSIAELMYNDISYLLYEIEEKSREHIDYIRSMKLISVPEEKETGTIKLEEMDIYNTMVQMLPLECASVAFVLHCMTEQVDALCRDEKSRAATPEVPVTPVPTSAGKKRLLEKENPVTPATEMPEETKQDTRVKATSATSLEKSKSTQSIPQEDKEIIDKIYAKLTSRLNELDIDYGVSQVPESQVARLKPLVLLHGDSVLLKSYHVLLPELDLNAITRQILENSPPANLWRLFKRQHGYKKYRYNHHIHKLWRCMDKSHLTLSMLKSYLHLLILEKMECSSNNEIIELYANKFTADQAPLSPHLSSVGNMSKNTPAFPGAQKTPYSEPEEAVSARNMVTSRSSNLSSLKEMMGCSDLACLTEPTQPMLTGSAKDRSAQESLHKFTAVQVYSVNAMLQSLAQARREHNCVDYKYYPPTDVVLLNFHNYNDKDGTMEKTWKGVLATPTAFRDFKWHVWEGEAYKAQMKANEAATNDKLDPDELKGDGLKDKCGPIPEEEFLLPNNLKHEDMLAKQAAEMLQQELEDTNEGGGKGKGKGKGGKDKKGGKASKEKVASEGSSKGAKGKKSDKSGKSKKGEGSKSSVNEDKSGKSKKGKKSKAGSKDKLSKSKDGKKAGKAKSVELANSEIEIVLPVVKRLSLRCANDDEPFTHIGYDMGELRLQAQGLSKRFYSLDGTEVRVDQHSWLYGKHTLTVQLIKRGHVLTFHSVTGPGQPHVEEPLAFHLTSAFGAILAFGKRVRERKPVVVEKVEVVPPPPEKAKKGKGKGKQDDKGLKSDKKSKTSKVEALIEETPVEIPAEIPEEPPRPWEYELRTSWPTGLYVETVIGTSDENPFHIKQHYLQKGPHCNRIADEDYRLFLNCGTVLKFMTNGNVEILKHDSTIVTLKSFSKPVATQESFNVFMDQSATSPEPPSVTDQDPSDCYSNDNPRPPRPPPTPPPALPPLLQIDNYHVTLPSGKQFSFAGGVLDESFEKLMHRVATDHFAGEVFTRRGDGTNTLLTLDGRLVTTFADGTRITTSCSVDRDELATEWTDEERAEITETVERRREAERAEAERKKSVDGKKEKVLRQMMSESAEGIYGENGSLGSGDSFTMMTSSLSVLLEGSETHVTQIIGSNVDVQEGDAESPSKQPRQKKKPRDIFEDEGFILVHMNTYIEHPNYATVIYRGASRSATLEMPHDMKVKVTAQGTITANVDNKTSLQVNPEKINFECLTCDKCDVMSQSTIDLTDFGQKGSDGAFCTSTDSWNQTVTVTCGGDSQVTAAPAPGEPSPPSEPGYDGRCPPRVALDRRRVFVLRRDGTGDEFVPAAQLKQHLVATGRRSGAIALTDQVPNKSNLLYHTTLTPVRDTESDKWLTAYRSKSALPTNLKRKDLRSTYGVPPTWIQPFPRGRGIATTTTTQQPSTEGGETEQDRVFVMRIVQEMEPFSTGTNPIATIQEGLVRYWTAATEKIKTYTEHPILDKRTKEEKTIEHNLLQMALGLTSVSLTELSSRNQLDPETTLNSDLPSRYQPSADQLLSHPREQLKTHPERLQRFREERSEAGVEREELKRLLRTHAVKPYFKTEAGATFLRAVASTNNARVEMLNANACAHKNAAVTNGTWECPCLYPESCIASDCQGTHAPDFFRDYEVTKESQGSKESEETQALVETQEDNYRNYPPDRKKYEDKTKYKARMAAKKKEAEEKKKAEEEEKAEEERKAEEARNAEQEKDEEHLETI